MKDVNCGECGSPMKLRRSKEFTYPETGLPRLYYSCSRFPQCRGTVRANADGSPIGTPANRETKDARSAAYLALEDFRRGRGWNRSGTLSWLSKRLRIERGGCQVSNFDLPTCKKVLSIVEAAKERQAKAKQKDV